VIARFARDAARKWVLEKATKLEGFYGAFYAGSSNGLADDAEIPATSDLDVMVVLADGVPPVKPGKFVYKGALLEVSYPSAEQFQSPEAILSHYHLGSCLRTLGIILDPSGHFERAPGRWCLESSP
jgi:hypothetical protein